MRIKSKDIAEALGVSPATVSLALNDRPGVNEKTRRRILEYINELEGHGTKWKDSDHLNVHGTILMLYYIKNGIIMHRKDAQKPEKADFFDSIKREVEGAGYHFLYEEFLEKEQDLESAFIRWKQNSVCGIYIMAAEMTQADLYPFQKLKIPIVVGDNLFYDLGMDSFLIDNKEGIARGVDYLVDKGHSHIVYLAENSDIFNFKERREAFVQEMKKRECGDNSNRIHHMGNTVGEVYESMNHYVREGFYKTTSFVLESSVISLGVSKSLLEHNVRIPRDISLIGFDALPSESIPGIDLTLIKGVHTNRHRAALKHLLRNVGGENGDGEVVRVYYQTKIIEGKSVFDKKRYIYRK